MPVYVDHCLELQVIFLSTGTETEVIMKPTTFMHL